MTIATGPRARRRSRRVARRVERATGRLVGTMGGMAGAPRRRGAQGPLVPREPRLPPQRGGARQLRAERLKPGARTVARLASRSRPGPGTTPMMTDPLNAWMMLDSGPSHSPYAEIVSRLPSGEVHRYTYADFGRRTRQLMHALDGLGLERGERVATLAWNSYRHLEAYFGGPVHREGAPHPQRAALGRRARLHHPGRRRPRRARRRRPLSDDRGDRAATRRRATRRRARRIGTGDVDARRRRLRGADRRPARGLPRLDIAEDTPMGLCYTSGTTGRPKGALYTHRSSFLHALAVTSAAAMSIGPGDSVLPQVPMFHANAWGMPYAAALVGAKQVFFAGALEPAPFVDLLVEERVTVAAGRADRVARHRRRAGGEGESLPDLRHIVCGGSPAAKAPHRALVRGVRHPDDPGLGHDRDVAAGLDGLAAGADAGLERGRGHGRGPDPGRAAVAGHPR